jgi:hypothetical protein
MRYGRAIIESMRELLAESPEEVQGLLLETADSGYHWGWSLGYAGQPTPSRCSRSSSDTTLKIATNSIMMALLSVRRCLDEKPRPRITAILRRPVGQRHFDHRLGLIASPGALRTRSWAAPWAEQASGDGSGDAGDA